MGGILVAYKRISPIPEVEGGTNQTTYTEGDILYASATDTLSKLTAGSDDQVLTLASGVPSWADASTGGDVFGPGSSTDRAIATWNGTAGTNLYDNSSTNITSSGEMTNTSQPCFLGYVETTINNVTGNNTVYTLGDTDVGAALTEVVDQSGDFVPGASGGAVFTAPVTGNYLLCGAIRTDYYSSAINSYCRMVTSNGTYQFYATGGSNVINSNDLMEMGAGVVADMDAMDTAKMQILVNGEGADTIGIIHNKRNTYFSGALMC